MKAMMAKQFRLLNVMRETLIERRDHPRDDIISMLWQAGVDGRPTTMDDMEDYAVLLFLAGLDTVVNGASFLMLHLAGRSRAAGAVARESEDHSRSRRRDAAPLHLYGAGALRRQGCRVRGRDDEGGRAGSDV